MSDQRYHGSCHCQSVRCEDEFDLAAGSNRCNGSICSKARAWFLFARGDRFTLLAGEDVLTDYRWLAPGRHESGLASCVSLGMLLQRLRLGFQIAPGDAASQ